MGIPKLQTPVPHSAQLYCYVKSLKNIVAFSRSEAALPDSRDAVVSRIAKQISDFRKKNNFKSVGRTVSRADDLLLHNL